MAAPGAYAVLVALTTLASSTAAVPADSVKTAVHLPRIILHAPATVPAAASPRLPRDQAADTGPDVDVTGPSH